MRGAHHPESGLQDASQQDPRATLRSLQDAARQESARQQQEQARQAAARRLREAARFAVMHAGARPLWEKRLGSGKAAVLVRLEWPGVLRVLDPMTGRELARSEAGAPDKLAADFDPLAGLIGRGQA